MNDNWLYGGRKGNGRRGILHKHLSTPTYSMRIVADVKDYFVKNVYFVYTHSISVLYLYCFLLSSQLFCCCYVVLLSSSIMSHSSEI